MTAALVVLAHLAVLGAELPYVARKRLRREFTVMVVLVAANLGVSLALVGDVPLPSPTLFLEWLFAPLAGVLGGG